MTTHPFTLYEDEQARVVQLGGEYSTQRGCLIDELKAVFYASGLIELHRFKNCADDEVTRFNLSENEITALFESWETLKAEQGIKKLAEQKRIADAEAEAYQLASTCKVIQIEKRNDGGLRWNVTLSDFGWHGCSYVADDLLECVKEAIEYCRPIQEAYKLAKDYPINFNHEKGTSMWWITINNLFGDDAFQNTILDVVQQAIATYKQWQAEQDQLIKTND